MKKISFLTALSLLLLMSACKHNIKYPLAHKVDTVTDYFGTKIADPYRWLENDTSAETAEWVKQENEITNEYLSKIPFREKLKERLTKIWDYPKVGVPYKEGPWYFFSKNNGLQNQFVLYVQKGLDGTPRVLLDPNTFSKDGTIALAGTSVSHDGKYMAYSLATSGSDWNEILVMEVETGKKLTDTLKWVKFSGMSWQGDGFYYSRYDEPGKGGELSGTNENHKVFFHKIGTPQSEDKLVYANPNFPLRNYNAGTTDDERFLLLYESESTSGNALYYKDLSKNDKSFKKIAEGFEYDYSVVDNIGDKLLMITNYKAPKKKLVLVDPADPDPKKWKELIPEATNVLEWAILAGDKMVAEYQQRAHSVAFVYDLNGKFQYEIKLPGLGSLAGFSGKKGENVAFYGYTSFNFPTTVYKYDMAKNESSVYSKPPIDFDPDKYEVKQVEYASKDMTAITMFIVHKKGLQLNGQNPTMLYGYGGFNISMTPGFSISRLLFLESGGVFAIPNIRGGGEYGEEWHKAGIKQYKQNVFDDFIAAAEYLIAEKYTSPEKLAIMGGSNGGLLVGACMTQRPDLFKVAIPQVGVLDMLRYHKFTIGHAWASDYGTSDTKEGFDYLIKYSPLHNIKDSVSYPATLAFTADHDDRVVPAHTFKFIATLQEKNMGENPILVRIETKAGHGAGKPTAKTIEEVSDLWSFVFYNLKMKPKF